jgi:hypothetical protein
MPIFQVILVQESADGLRPVFLPKCRHAIELDIADIENSLQSVREHFATKWHAEVHALRWIDLPPVFSPNVMRHSPGLGFRA